MRVLFRGVRERREQDSKSFKSLRATVEFKPLAGELCYKKWCDKVT